LSEIDAGTEAGGAALLDGFLEDLEAEDEAA